MQNVETFAVAGCHGEVVAGFEPSDLTAAVRRLSDPAAAEETIHWGRNYLFRTGLETTGGRVDVVVKQFRCQGLRDRFLRCWRGSKAARSFRIARAFQAAGLPTPEPVMLIEANQPEGPSFFVTRHLPDTLEARYLFRAANQGDISEAFPDIDFDAFLTALGRALRRMHEAGFFHRDLSIGNVLLQLPPPAAEPGRQPPDLYLDSLYIVDLNRTRIKSRLSLGQRTRDLCRLAVFRPEHRQRLLAAYWGENAVSAPRRWLYLLYHHGFHLRIESKKKVRQATRRWRAWLRPRRAHPHIPAAPRGASARDKIVWDHLSDQPHQHAGGLEKLRVRLADAPNHARLTTAFVAAAPRIWRRYRHLMRDLYQREIPWDGAGICVRPYPQAPGELLTALEDLGADKVLLRLHPWEEDHDDEEALARELASRGYDLAFSLPQNRELVRDAARWQRKVEELAERFTPFGRHFQLGQAINRSKWGIWKYDEYLAMAVAAADILRRHGDIEILGPSVIDFELHATAAVLNLAATELRFDAVSSLLYVDRRGAPENTQLGFGTVGKVVLLQAIAETSRNSEPRSWITEVNWPLWEGPHSPAGRTVSVDEQTQADYLVRYFLLSLTTGAVERVYWWQLVARGYGLIAPQEDDAPTPPPKPLRRRPSFRAFANLLQQLRGTRFVHPLPSPPGTCLFLFRGRAGAQQGGRETVAGWSVGDRCAVVLPRRPQEIIERDGASAARPATAEVEVSPSVRYFLLPPS